MPQTPIQLELVLSTISRIKKRLSRGTHPPAKQHSRRKKHTLLEDQLSVKLQAESRRRVAKLGLAELAERIKVAWQPRFTSTAGRAFYHFSLIELNPHLRKLDGDEVERTLWHEVAHLVAHARHPRRRIAPHGAEWQQACADLGIPGEPATHRLPLPTRSVVRRWIYQCPVCRTQIYRVRRIKRATACYTCCKTHNGGHYDTRFRLHLINSLHPQTPH